MFTLEQTTSFEQVIKKSRFIAVAGPLVTDQAAKDFIAAHSDPDANHNCWAWRVGQTYRFSDDGEPSGIAGKPLHQPWLVSIKIKAARELPDHACPLGHRGNGRLQVISGPPIQIGNFPVWPDSDIWERCSLGYGDVHHYRRAARLACRRYPRLLGP